MHLLFFVLCPTNAQLFHKLSHFYTLRHYGVILRQLVTHTLPSYTVFQMQQLVIQFTTKMFSVGFIMGTGSFPGVKSGRCMTLTSHPLLVPWSWKSRAIPLLPLWTVQPV